MRSAPRSPSTLARDSTKWYCPPRKRRDAQRDEAPEIAVRGAVVAVATIRGCHLDAACRNATTGRVGFCSPWAVRDQFHWQLTKVRTLRTPVSCRGALGLWTLPDDVEAAVRAQIGKPTPS